MPSGSTQAVGTGGAGGRSQGAAPRPADAGFHWRIWAAEGAGTALLMLGGLSAVALVSGSGSPVAELLRSGSARLLVTGLLFAGCVSLISVSPLGRLSGAHLNPVVTLVFRVLGRVSRQDVAGYLAVQLGGALLGSLAFKLLWGSVARSVGGGVTHSSVSTPVALGLEAGMTAILVGTILLFVSHERLARWTPLVIWPVITALVWKGAQYTGTSLNPARSEGPAVVFGDLADLWLYFVAPTAGGLAVAALWRLRGPAAGPKTAKLFHDPRYPCSLASAMPAAPPDAPMVPRGGAGKL
jgi:aquaporin Z